MQELVNRKATINAAALELAAHLRAATAAAERLAQLLAEASLVEAIQPPVPSHRYADDEPEGLWTVTDVAKYLKASRSSIYNKVAAGTLPCVHIGGLVRFDPARIRALTAEPKRR